MSKVRTTLMVLTLLVVAAPPAAAQCPAFICYLDLVQGAAICPNPAVYQYKDGTTPIDHGDFDDLSATCPTPQHGVVVRVDLPAGCTGLEVIAEFGSDPEDHFLNIGDSITNNGFGGDSGSVPMGQNAEVHVVDDQLFVFSAADNPTDVETLATANLQLRDGALKIVVRDQAVSWSQPYSALETPDLERLFFLPNGPVAPDNRTLFVGVNRVINDLSRLGCGVRHVLMFTR